jgi:nucleotide-binding universal stress UspA family protein
MLAQKSQQRLGVVYDGLATYSRQELNYILGYFITNSTNANHSFEAESIPGALEEVVKEVIRTKDIDLVIMGTQGATGAKELFMGSNTVKVLKKIKNTAVLVVPSDYNFQIFKKLAFLTDFSRTYEKFELIPLTELVSLWKSEMHILHIAVEFWLNDQQKANRKILEDRLKAFNFSFKNGRFEGTISNSVEKYIAENNIDFLAMIRHQHGFWENVIGKGVVKKVAFHAKVPVLMLPEQVQD